MPGDAPTFSELSPQARAIVVVIGLACVASVLRLLSLLTSAARGALLPDASPSPAPARARQTPSYTRARGLARPRRLFATPSTPAADEDALSTGDQEASTAAQPAGVGLKRLARAAARQAGGWHGPTPPPGVGAHSLHLTALKGGHGDAVVGLAWSPDGRALATACLDRAVRVYAVPADAAAAGGSAPRKRTPGVGVAAVAVVDDAGGSLAVLTRGALDAAGLAAYAAAARGDAPPAWQVGNLHGGVRALSLAAGGRGPGRVLVTASEKTSLEVYRASTGALVGAVDTAGLRTHDAAVSGDGRLVAVATFAPAARVYRVVADRTTGEPAAVAKAADLAAHDGQVLAVALDAAGARAATASRDGTWAVWDVSAVAAGGAAHLLGRHRQDLPAGAFYRHLALGPGGVLAASSGEDLHFLDADTGALLDAVSPAHGGEVAALAWAPRVGRGLAGAAVLASAGDDRAVHLWRSPKEPRV